MKAPRFSLTLSTLRRDAGFSTAYAFYRRNGGSRTFPFTFAHYLKLEKGVSLPRPEWLAKVVFLLRIPPTDEGLRRLVTDYLRDYFDSGKPGDYYTRLVEPLLRPEQQPAFGRYTAKKILSTQAYHLTPEQYETTLSSAAAFWAFECLANDRGAWSVAELASRTGLSEDRLAAALAALAGQGLVTRASAGRWRSPLAERYYVYPTDFPAQPEAKRRREKYIVAMTRRRGAELGAAAAIVGADPAAIRRAVDAFTTALETGVAEAVYEPTPTSGLFIIEASVRKVASL